MTDTVDMPARVARLPRWGGYPVPAVVYWCNGRPDFRVADAKKRLGMLERGLCDICGEPLEYWRWFIGGPLCFANSLFFDGPKHEVCARYSLRVCPYLAAGRDHSFRSVEIESTSEFSVEARASNVRPELIGLGQTRGYRLDGRGPNALVRAGSFVAVEWYDKAGRRLGMLEGGQSGGH